MSISSKYGYKPDHEAIARHLDLIAGGLEEIATEELYKKCFGIMDQTTLANDDTPESVKALVRKVNSFAEDYPAWPLPASICVYPNFASVVASERTSKEVHVTTVAGCFPTSQSFLPVKLQEIEMAVRGGADEIDIVLALNSFLTGDYETAGAEIKASRACIDKVAKELHDIDPKLLEEATMQDYDTTTWLLWHGNSMASSITNAQIRAAEAMGRTSGSFGGFGGGTSFGGGGGFSGGGFGGGAR